MWTKNHTQIINIFLFSDNSYSKNSNMLKEYEMLVFIKYHGTKPCCPDVENVKRWR